MVFQIFLNKLNNKTIIINDQSITPTMSIQQFRKFIAKKQDISDYNAIRLIFAGKQLQNTESNRHFTFSDYSIINQSTIFMALRLKGGGNQSCSCISRQAISEPKIIKLIPKVILASNSENKISELKIIIFPLPIPVLCNNAESRASESKNIDTIPKPIIQQILIQIEYLNSCYKLTVNQKWTVYQLKQKIYQMCHKSLEANSMKLSFAGVKLSNQKLVSTYKLKSGNKIIQSKLDLDQVIQLIVAYEQDQITLETITARMPCGHVIGRDCMTGFLRSLITNNSYKILCPSYKPNGELCQCEWDYPLCRKIGVLTKQEKQQFQKGLSQNWVRTFCMQCPSCHNMLVQDQKSKQSNEKKINCPNTMCKNNKQYFCWTCLKKWKSNNKLYCENQECKSGNCSTQLIQLKDNGVMNNYIIPKYRKCPNCNLIIQRNGGCKHMTCKCSTQFCFVCLKLNGKNGWPCGNQSNYCGQITDRQKMVE